MIDSLQTVLPSAAEDTNKIKTLNALSWYLRSAGDPTKARAYADTAIVLADRLNFKSGSATAYNMLGLLDMGKSNYQSALRNYNISLKLNEQIGNRGGIASNMSNMGLVYWAQSNYPEALKNYTTALKLSEEAEDKGGQIGIYNNIGSIYGAQGNYPEALKNFLATLKLKSHTYLARFAKLLRMLLENASSPFIPLARELEFLELYLSLEKLRIPDLKYSIRIDKDINTEKIKIPNMILQPYIENAIWHGLSHKKMGNRELQLRVQRQAEGVQYEIEDNGVGRKKAAELKSEYRKEHKSKGMELLTKRFKLLNEEYRFDIRTSVTDVLDHEEVAGTLVTIQAPWELNAQLKQAS